MAGSYKGRRLQYKGKSFGLMLLLAFSAALFGVMAVQKIREKRVLNILLKEQDKELSAFQILLQKERDQAQDSRRKTEEMKDMIDTLSSQKRELEGWILEMESTVSSLKEDRQTKAAAALEDRAKEMKTLREREMDISKKEFDEASLREIPRMRGNSDDGMKFEVADETDKVLAQPVRHGGGQLNRKRSKKMRVIARNQRMGKRGNRRIVRGTRGDQAQGGNVRERLTTETMNRAFESTGFNNGDESKKIQSKIEISFEKSADESHQEENVHDVGEDGEKQPKSDDGELNKSENRSESMDSPNMTGNDRDSVAGDEMARTENTDLVESTDNSSRETEPEDTKQHDANNNWN